jgi:hypothetical protein
MTNLDPEICWVIYYCYSFCFVVNNFNGMIKIYINENIVLYAKIIVKIIGGSI